MRDFNWTDAVYIAAGFATGFVGHELAAREKQRLEIEGGPEGFEIGGLISALSTIAGLVFDRREVMTFGAGLGAGVSIHDLQWHIRHGEKFRPMYLMGQKPLVDRWTRIIKIDPDLPRAEKEAIIIPLIRDLSAQCAQRPLNLVHPQYALPPKIVDLQRKACAAFSSMLRIAPNKSSEMVKVQGWFQRQGVQKGGYEPSEGLTSPIKALRRADVDRFRLPSLLLTQWNEDGVVNFDCDDGGITVGGVSFYNNVLPYWGVISQYRSKMLHHIFPIIKVGNRLYCLETINNTPPYRISDIRKVFKPLTRVVLVRPDGSYSDIKF